MLDPRLYRAALAPVLFALILAAFSLEDRPAPLRSTLAPDAFEAQRAYRDLRDMANRFPNRRKPRRRVTFLTVARQILRVPRAWSR